MITEGKTVRFEYTLTLADGSPVASKEGGTFAEYVHGESKLLPALERELEGMDVDDTKTITLEAEEAYGPVNPQAFREIPLDQLPPDARTVGARLSAEGYDGPITVHEVKDESAVLNFNHPLAGEALTFDVKIVSVE